MATPVQTQFTHVSVTMTQGNAVSPQVFGFALNSAMLTPHVSSETLPDPGYTPLASAPPRDTAAPSALSQAATIVSATSWPGADTTAHSDPDSGGVNIAWPDTE